MIQVAEHYYGYLLIRCADEERDEELNVGILAFDADSGRVECRISPSLERVERNLPNVPIAHVRALLQQAQESASELLTDAGVEGLVALARNPRGTLRFSPVRSMAGGLLEHTADLLLRRYVEMPPEAQKAVAGATTGSEPSAGEITSRRVIGAVETRLDRHRLPYKSGVTLIAHTKSALELPIWFPLQVGADIYIDGLEVKQDQARTLERSRAIAQKVLEAHRAEPQSLVNVLIRDPWMGDDGSLAEAIVSEGAQTAGRTLTVRRYSKVEEIDVWMKDTLSPRFDHM